MCWDASFDCFFNSERGGMTMKIRFLFGFSVLSLSFIVVLLIIMFYTVQKDIQEIRRHLQKPCAVYNVATDYVIVSEDDIIGVNKKEK